MRLARPLAAAALTCLLIAACDGGGSPSAPDDANIALSGPFPVALPAPGDNLVDEEEWEICKAGGPGTFNYTIVDKTVTPNVTTNHTTTLADGECKVIDYVGGKGHRITITEVVPAGYTLDSVVTTVRTGSPYPGNIFTTRVESGPTVLDSLGSTVAGFSALRGGLSRFFNSPIPVGSIGDFVWSDLNANGIQDGGEPGIAGVTVTLGGDASATTTTDGSGAYLFSNLVAGNYTVTVGTPAGTIPSPSDQGGDDNVDSDGSGVSTSLAAGENDTSIDFGFVPTTGEIGDFVWADNNGNGIQDGGEAGIGGVTVTLAGPVNGTTVTNGSGAYAFTNLPPGNYTVTVGTPAGYTASPSNVGSNDNVDSDGSGATTSLSAGEIDHSIDFGFVPPPTGQIGDFVWKDTNGDGIQQLSEVGIPGVTVTLSGPVSGSTVTDGAGAYLFTGLPLGSYTVTVGTPAGHTVSPSFAGGDPNKDSNGSPASVTLPTQSSIDLSIDFGFVPIPPPPTTVTLCKVGTSASFTVSVNGGTPQSHSLTAGQCKVVDTHQGFTSAHDVLITETVPSGTTLDSIVSYSTLGERQKETGPNSESVIADDNRGWTVTFYNRVLPPPPTGGQGCTPGYWKQPHHFDSWVTYQPNQLFSSVFENAFPGMTLVQVLGQGGGGLNALGRHTVAALLNGASGSGVNSNATSAQVIAAFNAVFPSSSKNGYDALHNQFAGWNEQGCPLN